MKKIYNNTKQVIPTTDKVCLRFNHLGLDLEVRKSLRFQEYNICYKDVCLVYYNKYHLDDLTPNGAKEMFISECSKLKDAKARMNEYIAEVINYHKELELCK